MTLLVATTVLGCGSLARRGGAERPPATAAAAHPLLVGEPAAPARPSGTPSRPAGISAALRAAGPYPVALSELPTRRAPASSTPWIGDPDEGIESPLPREEVERQRARALAAPPSAAIWLAAPAAGAVRPAAPASGPPEPGPTLVADFDALDITDCCGGSQVVPPDPELAVGPSHVVATVNLSLAVFDKAGTPLLASPVRLTTLFAGVTGCDSFTFDPNVLYDEEADRFVVGADGNFTRYCVAASAGPDPTGAWLRYSFATDFGGPGFDYPRAGVGRDAVYVGANQFTSQSGAFIEGRVYALDKWALYGGGAMEVRTHGLGAGGTTPQPANLHGYLQGGWPDSGPHYVVSDRFTGALHTVWAWSDPFGADVLSEVGDVDLNAATGVVGLQTVASPQLGSGSLTANDWRGLDTEYRNGELWIANTVSCNPGAGTVNCVRWAQIDPATPAVLQAGVFASDGDHRLFPDLAVNHCGDMAIGYTLTNAGSYPSIYVTGRRSVDAAGSLRAETLLKAGVDEYSAWDGSPYRWGDYTGMTSDPDGLTFWYLGEYSRDSGLAAHWATRVGAFELPGCPVLALSPLSSDLGAVEVGHTSSPVELLLANLGNSSSAVSALTLSNTDDFALDVAGGSAPCGSATPVLAPAASCTVTLSFSPTLQALFAETLTVASAGAPDAVVDLGAVGYTPCPYADEETLTGGPVTTSESVFACSTVTATAWEVGVGGEVTATAGVAIVLGEDTVIAGDFTAELDPFLALP